MSQKFTSAGEDSANSRSTTITSGGSANTKGLFSQLIASTPFTTNWILLEIGLTGNGDHLLDIAIGGSGSEQVIIPNILRSERNPGSFSPENILLPIFIPKGSRLSARHQCTQNSVQLRVKATLISGGVFSSDFLGICTTYGANLSNSGGIAVDAGGSVHTKGSYSEITAATTRDIKWIIVCTGNKNNAEDQNGNYLIDIAIGSSGSEQIIIPNLYAISAADTSCIKPSFWSIPCRIPIGSRIAIRMQASINDATDRIKDFTVIGIS